MLPKKNIIANLLGGGWLALMQLLFAPIYISVLGIEAFGLIGVWITLQAVSVLFDLGLGTTINRELARLSVSFGKAQRMRDLVRTFEVLYLPAGLLLGIAFVFAGPGLAMRWLDVQSLNTEVVRTSVALMIAAVALQWPHTLYSSALLGLQRHVCLNVVLALVATLRGPGSAAVLWFLSPTLQAFFICQIVASAVQSLLAGYLVWRGLPSANRRSRFRFRILRITARFAAGMLGITMLSVLLTQLDKVVLSGVLPIAQFGYYTLAAMAAAAMGRLIGPVFAAIYPRLTELVTRADVVAVSSLYHQSSRLMSVLVLPATVVCAFFAEEILLFWTHDPATAATTAPVLSLLMIGTALNGIMHMPYALQLAHGWTQLAFRINLVAVAVLGPLTYVAATQWGMVGAAWIWVSLNLGYFLVGVQLMHRRLLPGEQWRWYLQGTMIPVAVAVSFVSAARWALEFRLHHVVSILEIGLVLTGTLAAVFVSVFGAQLWRRRRAPLSSGLLS